MLIFMKEVKIGLGAVVITDGQNNEVFNEEIKKLCLIKENVVKLNQMPLGFMPGKRGDCNYKLNSS